MFQDKDNDFGNFSEEKKEGRKKGERREKRGNG
jgi:hypothetical protein